MTQQRIRINCVGLCRIRNIKNHFLLGMNHDRQKQGIMLLTPLGGSFEHAETLQIERWQGVYEKPEKPELRFYTSVSYLPAIRDWFSSRNEREITPFREIYEELVEEFAVLDALNESDLYISLFRSLEHERVTQRRSAAGENTHYFIEIFEVRILKPQLEAQLQAVRPESNLMWASEENIQDGYVQLGEKRIEIDARILV